ncbi:MAG: NAD(P)/FAD-dependent oxidoreductase [Bacteroidota bacterium]|nr:NAD(P)/FAD-dependent oxidoreductase [Bacteroidota bacterium]
MLSRRHFLQLVLRSGLASIGLSIGCRTRQYRDTPGDIGKSLRIHFWQQRREPAHQLFWHGQVPARPSHSVRCDVLVVGAGPAGLASAWLLQRLGYDVLVVENEPVVGGATRTEQRNGAFIPCGAVYFVELSSLLEELLQEMQLQPIPLSDDALWITGTAYPNFWHDSVLNELPLSARERAAFRRFRTELQAHPQPPTPITDRATSPGRQGAAHPPQTRRQT